MNHDQENPPAAGARLWPLPPRDLHLLLTVHTGSTDIDWTQLMCLQCHTDLTTAVELINGSVDRHPAHKTTSELQVASEAVHDANLLDTYLGLSSRNAVNIHNIPKGHTA